MACVFIVGNSQDIVSTQGNWSRFPRMCFGGSKTRGSGGGMRVLPRRCARTAFSLVGSPSRTLGLRAVSQGSSHRLGPHAEPTAPLLSILWASLDHAEIGPRTSGLLCVFPRTGMHAEGLRRGGLEIAPRAD